MASKDFPAVEGSTYVPGDEGYDAELAGFNTAYAHRPSVVVAARTAEDVRAAVTYAREHRLSVAVQATGHGLSVANEGGVVISTRELDGVRIDVKARTAWIEAGVQWGRVIEEAARFGLAPLSGSFPGVGAVSYTLGGGIGILAREFGYAADHLKAAELVTADGELRTVDAASDPELLWALRGAGHNFGVVTAIEIGLVPVERVYGGQLVFDGEHAEQLMRTWAAWTRTVPETVSSGIGFVVYPDIPVLPDVLRGRYVATVSVAFNGPAEEGERLVAPLRAVATPLKDGIREMPYTDSAEIYSDPPFPHAYTSTNALLSGIDEDALASVLKAGGPDADIMCVLGVRHLGGALARTPEDGGSALGHRDAAYLVQLITPIEGNDSLAVARSVQDDLHTTLGARTLGSALAFTFADGERATEAQTRSGYEAADYERLARLKGRLDPGNLFRNNRNIVPVTD
ncbi:oxidoreductase [Streptomyces spiroverticillatus]|uniref:Oxidoreductase n=1 Tax=Streptomyces finlayi TaxID=67296 RepID=A0A919C9J0_9ACTN|nr:FAD-binding oxidoreductase [Streptomyces finlayi]GHA03234.1 oxidoreductase [Streptomyces spiroverticillatus]GHC87393.1 oxidoreductase [Streptomyces finlayi]